MIRILQMIGSLNMGGSQTTMMNIYRNIDRTKIQFDFVLDHPNEIYFAEEAESMGARIYSMPGFHGTNSGEIKRDWNNFFYLHPEYKVLHSHVRSYASLYLPIAKEHGVKTIIHSHSTSSGSGITALVKDAMQRPLRKQADVLMACSTEAGVWLYGERACKGKNYVMLPNTVDTKLYGINNALREQYRSELGLEGKFVVGHVGRLHPSKNHSFLVNAFFELHEMNPDARLLIVGDGDLHNEIAQKISALGISSSVVMTGSRKDVPGLMQAMDVFAFPSVWEGMPTTVVEAQAAGLPCFVSDHVTADVGVTDLIHWLPIDDPRLWAQELNRREPKRDVRRQIIDAGFDVTAAAEKLCRIYMKLWKEAQR